MGADFLFSTGRDPWALTLRQLNVWYAFHFKVDTRRRINLVNDLAVGCNPMDPKAVAEYLRGLEHYAGSGGDSS